MKKIARMQMKGFVGAAVLATALSSAAYADGMPGGYAPAGRAFSWTGFYIGGNMGGAWGDSDVSGFVPATSSMNPPARALERAIDNGRASGSGVMGGLQAGYNWQRGSVVFGLETDINGLDLSEKRDSGLVTVGARTGRTVDEISTHWLYTLRPRIGFAVDRALFYGTGGLAVTNRKFSHTQSWDFADGCPSIGAQQFCHVGRTSDTSATWTVGGGVEYALLNNATLKAEYLWVDGADLSFTSPNAGFAGQPVNHSASIGGLNIFRVGLNLKFGDREVVPLK